MLGLLQGADRQGQNRGNSNSNSNSGWTFSGELHWIEGGAWKALELQHRIRGSRPLQELRVRAALPA